VLRDGATVLRPTAFIIRPDMPGFRLDGTVRKLGIRGSTQAELVFTDLYVPDDHVLGEVGKGFRVAVHASMPVGYRSRRDARRRASDCSAIHALCRAAQFGGPLASFEITQRKMATMAAETYAADAMVGALAAALDGDDVDASLELRA
jgi:alkylation response protein AidB-like acyl-CoA dehydrogenase